MDLGISGRRALVCAASKGLGKACALALSREGVAVTITARGAEALEATAAEIRAATGGDVTVVAGDITTPEGRAAALAACPNPDRPGIGIAISVMGIGIAEQPASDTAPSTSHPAPDRLAARMPLSSDMWP
jgi:NAD(P)-dependent dehydrogenase (short-subunit alcohol dehydrogenase family)